MENFAGPQEWKNQYIHTYTANLLAHMYTETGVTIAMELDLPQVEASHKRFVASHENCGTGVSGAPSTYQAQLHSGPIGICVHELTEPEEKNDVSESRSGSGLECMSGSLAPSQAHARKDLRGSLHTRRVATRLPVKHSLLDHASRLCRASRRTYLQEASFQLTDTEVDQPLPANPIVHRILLLSADIART